MGKYNVFCIDDDYPTNVYNQIVIEESQLFDSHEVFDSPLEALSVLKVQENKPDLLLVDINMPKMDGWTFIEALGNIPEYCEKNCKVFMLTTSSSPLDEEKSKGYACIKGIVEKPLTEQKLQTMLNK